MKLKEIVAFLDNSVPLRFQESYDNSGLQAGDPSREIKGALLTVDITDEVLDEALEKGCNMIISHHPLIFHPVKRITGSTPTERILMRALKNDISIYSAHTNLDITGRGVSWKMADMLSLKNVSVLSPLKNNLMKLVTYVPESHIDKVRDAVFGAGAGVIGNYDCCSFNAPGYGTYRGNENTNPFAGKRLELHTEKEIRLETVLLSHLKGKVVRALLDAHPYEEVAYDLFQMENEYWLAGLGCTGELESAMTERAFLKRLSDIFGAGGIRYSGLRNRKIRKVAVCGGSGISLLNDAIASGSDTFVTGEIKYHDFFSADNRILLVDTGHFESEKFTPEILYDLIIKKFPTFALRFSEINTNPINYF